MSILSSKRIGIGNTAEVYEYPENKVVKLYFPYYPKDCIDLEYKNSQLINDLSLPIPRSYELLQEDGRFGIVYDKVSGITLTEALLQSMDIEKHIKIFADLHKELLSKKVPEALSIKDILRNYLRSVKELSESGRQTVLSMLEKLPDEDGLCHGDYHSGNVLIDGDTVNIIDFYNICRGHRNFDIARTVYLTELTPAPEDYSDKEEILKLKRMATDAYLKEMGVSRSELRDYLTVTVAARFAELRPEQELERTEVRKYLAEQGIH